MKILNNFKFSSFLSAILFAIALLNVVPIIGQSIQIRESPANCYSTGVQTFNFSSSSGSPVRNTYTGTNANGGNPMRVIWLAGLNRWEIQQSTGSFLTDYYSTFASYPNPPSLSVGNWQQDAACSGGTLVQFNGTGTQTVLPIELVQFAIYTEGSKNHLTWTTASEVNNKGFDIERSADGKIFLSLAQVKAANKAQTYHYMDNQPLPTSYYRLRQIDYDGKETLSKVISISNKSKATLKAYPSVTTGILTIEMGNVMENYEGNSYQVFNLLGQQMLNAQKSALEVWRLDVSALPKGTYILRIGLEQVKFMKQ